MRILVVSDGRRGIENQALGLAEAVARQSDFDCEIATHILNHSAAFAAMPPSLQLLSRSDFGLPGKADLVIGCGRQAVAPLIALQRGGSAPFTVYIQDPRTEPSRFDLVVAPEHDGLSGPFVETMIGSPNRVTRDRLVGAMLEQGDALAGLPMPRAALLIGGDSKAHRMSAARIRSHVSSAHGLLAAGYSLMITLSRRTPPLAIELWEDFARQKDDIWFHHPDSPDPNPYFAFLGGADVILVTEDSTNMLTESCATGKPVYRLPMDGAPGKFQTLYDALRERCGVERFEGEVADTEPEPLLETDRVARVLLTRMADR